jgi:hypothetical protein
MTEDAEYNARIKDLNTGPWVDAMREMVYFFNLINDSVYSGKPIEIDKKYGSRGIFTLIQGEKFSEEKSILVIGEWLRSHFKKKITNKHVIRLRESFDDALEYFQLIELGVETGYVRLKDVSQTTIEIAKILFKYEPAINYLDIYDYITVKHLLNRIGIIKNGFNLPTIDDGASINFAGFLALHREWYGNKHLDRWLGMLDDYILGEYNQDRFYDYLMSGDDSKLNAIGKRYFKELKLGIYYFLTNLSVIGNIMGDRAGRYSVLYIYWLAKYFGYEFDGDEYKKNRDIWGDESWAKAVGSSPIFTEESAMRPLLVSSREFKCMNEEIEKLWNDAKELVVGKIYAEQLAESNYISPHLL